jgi:hypothetical protein
MFYSSHITLKASIGLCGQVASLPLFPRMNSCTHAPQMFCGNMVHLFIFATKYPSGTFLSKNKNVPQLPRHSEGKAIACTATSGTFEVRNPVFAKGRLVGLVKSLMTNDWDWEERMYLGDGN